ncbi:type III secretion system needle filament subunit SctF [Stenotrophomonas lacuserhaii]|uniref:type III secretion system needle filament subunit SctF n=1 Tax=Stenotrophomonas lacuserhaii TaxID=2760084 RepID=UPI0032ED1127
MSEMNAPVQPTYGWGDLPDPGGDGSQWDGWISNHYKYFDKGVNDLKDALAKAFEALSKSPSDPTKLADYQSALSEYNMYRMLQSNSTKSLSDQSKAVIRNLA